MGPYLTETFSPAEEAVLRVHCSSLDAPAFALRGLPEEIKGALFARYSRSADSLRRLLVREFVGAVESDGSPPERSERPAGGEGHPGGDEAVALSVERGRTQAAGLLERVVVGYGDDSVAQLGGAHLACEQVSNLLTKVLERGRLAAYLEQSTRYVAYDRPQPDGRWRYYRDPEILASPVGRLYEEVLDRSFVQYRAVRHRLEEYLAEAEPFVGDRDGLDRDGLRDGLAERAWRRALRARALDGARGLLPTATLSNVGIYASAQAFEDLVHRLRAEELPEARRYADYVVAALRTVIPSFLGRIDRPDRGGAAVAYRVARRAATQAVADAVAGLVPDPAPDVQLVDFDPDGEARVVAGLLYEATALPDHQLLAYARSLDDESRARIIAGVVGDRQDRRHRPSRAFERTRYRFDVQCDYGAFRDLQRHRLLTLEWQPLSPALGYRVPEDVEAAGLAPDYEATLARQADLYESLASRFRPQAPYALGLAWRVRASFELNAREAFHLLELRSQPQGHPSYRAVVLEMHRLIAEEAGHRALAAAMGFVVRDAPRLGRLAAERRSVEAAARHSGVELLGL